MDKLKEVLNYLLSSKNAMSLLIFGVSILIIVYGGMNYIYPKYTEVKGTQNDIQTKQKEYEGLLKEKEAKEAKEKANTVKIEDVPVKIFKPATPGLSVESSSIDLVTTVINMLEKTDNTIMDISYKVIPASSTNTDKPASVATVQLTMTINGTYTSFMDFIYTIYGYDYLATIKSIKVTPLKENKNILEINTVINVYVVSV